MLWKLVKLVLFAILLVVVYQFGFAKGFVEGIRYTMHIDNTRIDMATTTPLNNIADHKLSTEDQRTLDQVRSVWFYQYGMSCQPSFYYHPIWWKLIHPTQSRKQFQLNCHSAFPATNWVSLPGAQLQTD